jgi:hypothetical protein
MGVPVEVAFGREADIQAQSIIPGPLYLDIFQLMTVQPSGSLKFDNVIKVNESFDIIMQVRFRDVLSQLKVNFIANVNVLNMKTGNLATPYSVETVGTLPGGGISTTTIRWKLKATETGIFLMGGSMGFPESTLFDFTLGWQAGTEPPGHQWGPSLRVANFYVYDPEELPK